jgi:TPR repeat protein
MKLLFFISLVVIVVILIRKIDASSPERKAIERFRERAKQGDADAQIYLGKVYFEGLRGVKRDSKEAAKWYRLAADQGNASAQFSLGLMYEYGRGVKQSDEEAVKWYRLAIAQGHEKAMRHFVEMGYTEDDI